MPERTGSLATRTTIVVGAGLGVVAAVVGTGGWLLAGRALAVWVACLATLGPRQQLREATDLRAAAMKPGERAVAVGLPDDVHRWYALARGIDLPGCGAYGRDMLPAVEDRSVHWVMFLYPRVEPALEEDRER
ncbi:MAG: hypothetical protein ACKOGJ_01660, partial [Phycisphaerales bacterium]